MGAARLERGGLSNAAPVAGIRLAFGRSASHAEKWLAAKVQDHELLALRRAAKPLWGKAPPIGFPVVGACSEAGALVLLAVDQRPGGGGRGGGVNQLETAESSVVSTPAGKRQFATVRGEPCNAKPVSLG